MSFALLALVCVVALLGPMLSVAKLVHLPVVIGELLVGIVLGTTGFGVLHSSEPTFSFLADVGFVLVMFVAGSHVPLREPAMRSGLGRGLARAVAIGVLSVPVGLALAALFGTGHGLLYAVVIASSSASIVMPSLAGVPLTGKAMVEMLPQLAIADAACIIALPLAMDPPRAVRAGLGALAVAAAAGLAWLLLRWLQVSGRRRRLHQLSEDHELAIELRSVLAITFGVAAVAVAFNVSVMLAGFASGLAVAAVGEPRRVAKQVFALTEGFFSPLFFVWLGSSINLRELGTHPAGIALGVVLGVVSVLVHASMVVTRQPLPVAASTAAQLGVPVAAVTLGTTLGLLHDGEPAALMLGALITIAATVAFNGRLAMLARRDAPAKTAGTTQPGTA